MAMTLHCLENKFNYEARSNLKLEKELQEK